MIAVRSHLAIRAMHVALVAFVGAIVGVPASHLSTGAAEPVAVEEVVNCAGCAMRTNGANGALYSEEIFPGIFLEESYGNDYHENCSNHTISDLCSERTCRGTYELRAWKTGQNPQTITFQEISPASSEESFELGGVNDKTVLLSIPFNKQCRYWQVRTVLIKKLSLEKIQSFTWGCKSCNG
jgi:hypothetical protein